MEIESERAPGDGKPFGVVSCSRRLEMEQCLRVAPASEPAPTVLRVDGASGEHGRGGLALVQSMAMRHAERARGGAVSEASIRPVPRQAERARGVAGGDERFVTGLGDMGSASQHERFREALSDIGGREDSQPIERNQFQWKES